MKQQTFRPDLTPTKARTHKDVKQPGKAIAKAPTRDPRKHRDAQMPGY